MKYAPHSDTTLSGLRQVFCAVLFGFTLTAAAAEDSSNVARSSYIVQASSFETARAAVVEAGGEITHELRIIRGVGALLSQEERDEIAANPVLGIQNNRSAGIADDDDDDDDDDDESDDDADEEADDEADDEAGHDAGHDNAAASSPVGYGPKTFYPGLTNARALHKLGIRGKGVTIAVVDTGIYERNAPRRKTL